ncbi:MAG TPA: alpha/beta hydrolase [Caulobacteraceae bacterium]|nr:alpha/beta hydrolase [Caulobacteraceae bacterium]
MLANFFYGLLALATFAILFLAAYRGYRQGANRVAIAIRSPTGVETSRFAAIGGIEQWISIRGDDIANPVLLVLHGGPGSAMTGLTYARFRPLEAHFTVVQWDQRGAGKTYGRHGKAGAGEMSIARMVQDGIELVEQLRADLAKDKIILLGLSWGSILGTEMVRLRPDLFSAYVGTGQVVDMKRGEQVGYEALKARLQARSRGKALAALEAIGSPPYPSRKALLAERRILFRNGSALDRVTMRQLPAALLSAPGFSLRDAWATLAAGFFSVNALYEPLMTYDIRRLGTRFEVPMIYIQGVDDIQTPTALVEDYVAEVEAPEKALILIEGGGHIVIVTHFNTFLERLLECVKPLV